MSTNPSSFGDPLSYDVARTFALERMKIVAQGRVSSQVMANVELETWADHITSHLVVRMVAEVLAERVLDTTATVHWRGKAKAKVCVSGVQGRLLWAPLAAGAALACATPFLGVGAMVGALVLALLGVFFLTAKVKQEQEVPVSGDVKVPATYWRKFPKAEIVYPPSLGPYIMFTEMKEPNFYQEGS